MQMTSQVRKILSWYESDNPGTKANLARILMHGKLGGTRQARDPAGRSGLRARAGAQLRAESGGLRPALPFPARDRRRAVGLCRAARHDRGGRRHASPAQIPTDPQGQQRQQPGDATRTRRSRHRSSDALRLGCSAIGFTIYPGSDDAVRHDGGDPRAGRRGEVRRASPSSSGPIRAAASSTKEGETAIDICAYARAHGGAARRPHHQGEAADRVLEQAEAKKVYEKEKIDISTLAARIAHVVQCCFNGRRIVVFSGGEAKDLDGVLDEARAIRDGGGNGSIIGRNTFQRTREDALEDARADRRHLPGPRLAPDRGIAS